MFIVWHIFLEFTSHNINFFYLFVKYIISGRSITLLCININVGEYCLHRRSTVAVKDGRRKVNIFDGIRKEH